MTFHFLTNETKSIHHCTYLLLLLVVIFSAPWGWELNLRTGWWLPGPGRTSQFSPRSRGKMSAITGRRVASRGASHNI